MSNIYNHPILGTGVIRKYGATDRFSFDFKTYEIFACDDDTGTFRQAILGYSLQSLEEAEEVLGTIQKEPDFKGVKLFITEVSRKAVAGNFASSLIRRRQQPDLLA